MEATTAATGRPTTFGGAASWPSPFQNIMRLMTDLPDLLEEAKSSSIVVRIEASASSAPALASNVNSPSLGPVLTTSPSASCCWASVLNTALAATDAGSDWTGPWVPALGGRKEKSGGMISGALVIMANSSGELFSIPKAAPMLEQPESPAIKAPNRARLRRVCTGRFEVL